MVEELAKEYAGRVTVVSANVSEAMETASDLGIFGVPTLVFFKGGEEVGRLVGAAPKAKIAAEIQKRLGVK